MPVYITRTAELTDEEAFSEFSEDEIEAITNNTDPELVSEFQQYCLDIAFGCYDVDIDIQ